ncbi:hypothetical protein L7F22_002436 [Adiantum nelumboides]|nr:hypothetical protein [Adiantum nelumboides]
MGESSGFFVASVSSNQSTLRLTDLHKVRVTADGVHLASKSHVFQGDQNWVLKEKYKLQSSIDSRLRRGIQAVATESAVDTKFTSVGTERRNNYRSKEADSIVKASRSMKVKGMSEEIKKMRAQLEEDEQVASLMRGLRGQNLNDELFASSDVKMRLVESIDGGKGDTLPLVYNPETIAAYWRKRPGAVITRIVQLLSVAGGFLSGIASDILSKKLKENEVARAIELRDIVTSLGPAYIKLGQALSIRPDILSPAAMTELQKLCDKALLILFVGTLPHVASVDVGVGLEDLVETATRAEKRFGVINPSFSKKSLKKKKKTRKKKRRFLDDSSEDESDSDSDSDSDTDLGSDSAASSNSDSDYTQKNSYSERQFTASENAMFFDALRKPTGARQQEFASAAMTQTRSMKVAMAELVRPRRDSMHNVEESEGAEWGGEDAVEELEVDENFDVHDKDTEVWLRRVGLYDYACLPWALWEKNEFAEQQLCHLRENAGYIMEEKDVSPKLVAEVFKEAMILTLETQKAGGERIDSLEREVHHLQSKVEEVLNEKEALQEELTREVEDKIAHLILDNNVLMNRLTPLVDLERAALDGQGVTGVLVVVEVEVEILKEEVVFDYTKEL